MRTESGVAPIGYRATPIADSTVMPAPISLHAVNGWRGIGALAIVVAHLWLVTGFIRYGDLRPIALLVDLFFVLSGLLIAHAYMDKLGRASAIPEYIVRRFGRIWPVHAAMLGVLVLFEAAKLFLSSHMGSQLTSTPFAATGSNSTTAIWTNLLLVHSLGVHNGETWNFPSWSLSVEFATYAVFALFCLFRPHTRRVASAATIVLSIAILALAAPLHMRSTYDYGIFRCTAGFFAGSLLYDVLRGLHLRPWPLPTLVECLALALGVTWLAFCFDNALGFAAPVVFCLFILGYIQGRGLVSRLLLTKPFQFMAELSFTIYMVHAVVLVLLLAGLHVVERATGVPLFVTMVNPHPIPGTHATLIQVIAPASSLVMAAIVVGYLAAVLIVSYLAYRLIEIPGRVLFGSLAKRFGAKSDRKAIRASDPRLTSGMERR